MTDLMRDRLADEAMRRHGGPTLATRARPILILVGLIWLVFLLDLILPLERLGLIPRSFAGLVGIVTMPFLHGSFGHLVSNTFPLVILLGLHDAEFVPNPGPWWCF